MTRPWTLAYALNVLGSAGPWPTVYNQHSPANALRSSNAEAAKELGADPEAFKRAMDRIVPKKPKGGSS
jgi:hypothetical protein